MVTSIIFYRFDLRIIPNLFPIPSLLRGFDLLISLKETLHGVEIIWRATLPFLKDPPKHLIGINSFPNKCQSTGLVWMTGIVQWE